jgi:hypothetical protein
MIGRLASGHWSGSSQLMGLEDLAGAGGDKQWPAESEIYGGQLGSAGQDPSHCRSLLGA